MSLGDFERLGLGEFDMTQDDRMVQAGLDEELTAMAQLDRILRPLSEASASRAVRWIAERYRVPLAGQLHRPGNPPLPNGAVESTADLAELFATAGPNTQDQKALVAGYWFQVMKGATDLDAQAVNTELKHLGHGMKNITAAFKALISTKPQLVIQVRKAGTTRQARKKYRLTSSGIEAVRAMLLQETSRGE